MVVVMLAKALICFSGQCYPVLTGYQTPVGSFELVQLRTDQPGYGGSVLEFLETDKAIFAIHRVYPFDRRVNREVVIKTGTPEARSRVTKGCINIESSVYDALIKSNERKLVVEP